MEERELHIEARWVGDERVEDSGRGVGGCRRIPVFKIRRRGRKWYDEACGSRNKGLRQLEW